MKKFILILIMNSWVSFLFAHPGIGIVQNSKGEIFYTDLARVWKIGTDGHKSVAVPDVHTHDLFLDSRDNLIGEHLWYDESTKSKWGHFIWKYTQDGKFSKTIPDTEGFKTNFSFTQDPSGTMYWIETFKTESLLMKKSSDSKPEILMTLSLRDVRKQFYSQNGMFYYIDDNDLYRIDLLHLDKPVLLALDLDGFKGEDTKRKPNNNTMGIWDDPKGNIYVAVHNKNEVKKITRDGKISVVYTGKNGYTPTGGMIDKELNLWVLTNNLVNKVKVIKISMNQLYNMDSSSNQMNNYITGFLLLFIVSLVVWIQAGTYKFNRANSHII